jgi:predicted ABC-type ATPase
MDGIVNSVLGIGFMSKKILMVAGPNGAGKTTLTQRLIVNSSMLYEFINVDDIARSLAPIHPESMALTSSKLMIKRLKELLDSNKSFAFETTASGTNYLRHLKSAQSKGYEINLTFLWLANPEQAIKRVAQRVRQGGHHVAEEVIIRRYYLGLKNLIKYYVPLANSVLVMDSSSEESVERIIARKNRNDFLDVLDKDIWRKIEENADDR